MKTTKLQLLGVCVSLFALVSCQKNVKDLPVSHQTLNNAVESTVGRNEPGINGIQGEYRIKLWTANVQVLPNQYTFVWKVNNTNPGNGSGGTLQDLSHMDFVMCLENTNSMISAGYSANGTSWTNFTPSIKPDPSLPCYNGNVFKFDYGTTGSATTYYRIIFNAPQSVGGATAWSKSGKKTPCGLINFEGLNCGNNPVVVINGVYTFFGT